MRLAGENFIDACYGRNEGRIPLWIMRQAGRYLPEYQEIRKKVSFRDLCRSPQLIAEVVRQPIERFGFDAAILFSDILIILEPMGMMVDFEHGAPQIEKPIKEPEDVHRLKDIDIEGDLSFVLDGIREIKKKLPESPLIGFVGSPFTLACYLIEGRSGKGFEAARRFIHEHPKAAEELFDLLTSICTRFLQAQIDAGADAVQVFDSWGGTMSRDDYLDWSVRPINRLFNSLKFNDVPRILYINNVAPYLDVVADIDCEVIGVDHRIDISKVLREVPKKSVQGNLDPSVLFGDCKHVAAKAQEILESVSDHSRLIFNLGQGIQPQTPLKSVQALVETVHNYRP